MLVPYIIMFKFITFLLLMSIGFPRGPNERIDEVLMFYLYHLMFYFNLFYMLCLTFFICCDSCVKLFLYVVLNFFYTLSIFSFLKVNRL
jgi:hypothetical protein